MSGCVFRSYRKPLKIKVTDFVKGKKAGSVTTKTRYVRPIVKGSSTSTSKSVSVESIVPPLCDAIYHAPAMDVGGLPDNFQTVENEWEKIRQNLQVVFIESSVHSIDRECVACKVINSNCASAEPAVIVCDDCGPNNVYCLTCCTKLHSFIPFHVPKILMVSIVMFVEFFCFDDECT